MTAPSKPPAAPPPRRRYADPAPGSIRRSRDTQNLIVHVVPALFGLGVGLVWLGWTRGALPPYTPLVTAVAVWGIAQVAVRLAGGVAERYLGLTGATTPPRREYSAPLALVAQGRYEEAAAAWEIAAAESGGDPEPYLALARLYRDHLGQPEEAAAWFRRARRDATLPAGHDLLVSQELIELYRGKLGQPQRAIPELARICERFPGTPNAAAAEGELAALRAQIANERAIDG